MLNASNEGICVVSFEEKTTQSWFTYFVLKSSRTYPLNIILMIFSLWLLGYRTEFSCLYLPQGHNVISIMWLWSTDEYFVVVFKFERKSIFKLNVNHDMCWPMCNVSLFYYCKYNSGLCPSIPRPVHWYPLDT